MGIKEILEKKGYGGKWCDHCHQKIPARLTTEEEKELGVFYNYNSFLVDYGISNLEYFCGRPDSDNSYGEMERNSMRIFDKIKHKLYGELLSFPEITKLINSAWVSLGERVKDRA